MKLQSLLFILTLFLMSVTIQSCSDSDGSDFESTDLKSFVWESIGDSEYWIDPDVAGAERDKWNTLYYFLDSEHGIKCIYHYNFDYVAGSHTSDKKGYPFTYEMSGRVTTLWFEGSREDLKLTSNGDALEDSYGTKYTRRTYNSEDHTFIDEWLPFCWPGLASSGSGNSGLGYSGGTSSGSSYDFQLKASTIQAFVNGKSTRWVVWLNFATNNIAKRGVSSFEVLVRALNGTITNQKEYGTVTMYPQKGNLSMLVTGLQNVTDNDLHWWSACIFVTTYNEEELRLEFTPTWISSAGTLEGDPVTKNYLPTVLIEE